jgi:hypothetical protein
VNGEIRFRIYRSSDGFYDLVDDNTGRRLVSTRQEEFLLYEILCLLHDQRPSPTFCVPQFVGKLMLGFEPPK